MIKRFKPFITLVFVAALGACSVQTTTAIQHEPSKRWIGVMAVRESPQVNLVLAQSGYDPAVYYPHLRALLDAGQIESVPGNYALIPYAGGRPAEQPERFRTSTGVYAMWAPASFVRPGRAMCVQVPASWPAITGQLRYPASGGKSVNCRDFGPEAVGDFALTKDTAAMVVVIEPAG